MEVRFTKLAGRRYRVAVKRERGPELAPRQGPGYDEYLPHEAVHLIVEIEANVSGGVFGRIAAGQSNIFWPIDPMVGRRQRRRESKRRVSDGERADMGRSETLVSICQPLWEMRAGLRLTTPEWFSRLEPDDLSSPLIERIIGQLDEFARRWHALDIDESITIAWTPARRTSAPRLSTPVREPGRRPKMRPASRR